MKKPVINRNPSKEGFSLVEIIIVIAIMAILVGVIVLAVIPNIQRSRESKDFTKLDNILSSVNIAIANNHIDEQGWFEFGGSSSGGSALIIHDAVEDELGDLSKISMESISASNGGRIKVGWVVTNPSAPHIVVQVGDGTVPASYTTGEPSDSNGYRLFKIESGSGNSPFS